MEVLPSSSLFPPRYQSDFVRRDSANLNSSAICVDKLHLVFWTLSWINHDNGTTGASLQERAQAFHQFNNIVFAKHARSSKCVGNRRNQSDNTIVVLDPDEANLNYPVVGPGEFDELLVLLTMLGKLGRCCSASIKGNLLGKVSGVTWIEPESLFEEVRLWATNWMVCVEKIPLQLIGHTRLSGSWNIAYWLRVNIAR